MVHDENTPNSKDNASQPRKTMSEFLEPGSIAVESFRETTLEITQDVLANYLNPLVSLGLATLGLSTVGKIVEDQYKKFRLQYIELDNIEDIRWALKEGFKQSVKSFRTDWESSLQYAELGLQRGGRDKIQLVNSGFFSVLMNEASEILFQVETNHSKADNKTIDKNDNSNSTTRSIVGLVLSEDLSMFKNKKTKSDIAIMFKELFNEYTLDYPPEFTTFINLSTENFVTNWINRFHAVIIGDADKGTSAFKQFYYLKDNIEREFQQQLYASIEIESIGMDIDNTFYEYYELSDQNRIDKEARRFLFEGNLAWRNSNFTAARGHYYGSLQLFEEEENIIGQAVVLYKLGTLAVYIDNVNLALQFGKRALEFAEIHDLAYADNLRRWLIIVESRADI